MDRLILALDHIGQVDIFILLLSSRQTKYEVAVTLKPIKTIGNKIKTKVAQNENLSSYQSQQNQEKKKTFAYLVGLI